MATVRLIPRRAALLAALAAFALVACTQDDSEPTASAEATEAATAAGSEPLSAEQVFAAVSPSIAFVETPIATGSGILVTEFHLVTNAHVVWPFEQVRVLFPEGSEYLDSPVIGWDLMADLAIIRLPGGDNLHPTQLASGQSSPARGPRRNARMTKRRPAGSTPTTIGSSSIRSWAMAMGKRSSNSTAPTVCSNG